MDRATELKLMDEIIGLAQQKSAYLDPDIAHSPISRYASPERFAREHSTLFRRLPVCVAHASELQGPRAFVTRDAIGLPLLLTRDDTGAVRAFVNVCRHRGAKIERDATGCKRVFTCPYHGWSYDTQGTLRAVPQEKQGFPDLPRAERGLRRLPCVQAHGFIWIIADPDLRDMPAIDPWMAGLADDCHWLRLADHRLEMLDTFDIKANWKTLIEGGLEAYHFRVAHAASIAPYFPDNLSTYTMFGPHIRSILPRNTMLGLDQTPRKDWQIRRDANILLTFLPNLQLLVQQDHIVMIAHDPRAVDLTQVRIGLLVPKDAPNTADTTKHWQRNHAITVKTLMEDFDLGVEIQARLPVPWQSQPSAGTV